MLREILLPFVSLGYKRLRRPKGISFSEKSLSLSFSSFLSISFSLFRREIVGYKFVTFSQEA